MAHIQSLQFGQSLLPHFFSYTARFASVVVMNDNDLAVFGELDINLDGVRLLLPCEMNCGEGVFRRIKGGAAMGDNFHAPRLRLLQSKKPFS